MRPLLKASSALAAIAACACFLSPVPKGLDAESAAFLSQVRYIISKQERKAFLRLDPADRPPFIEGFWERRDPTPGSERNEFREDYLRRIDEANLLFKQGSTPGWLQDRGEIYITLGRPDHRETYPRGTNLYGKPEEIWWYGFFPIVFVDENWSGNFRLSPSSAYQIAEIAKARAQEEDRGEGRAPRAQTELDLAVSAEEAGEGLTIVIRVPYKAIWVKALGDEFSTELDVRLTAAGRDGATVWEAKKSLQVKATRAEALEQMDRAYEIRIDADPPAGAVTLTVEVVNRTGNARGEKSIELKR